MEQDNLTRVEIIKKDDLSHKFHKFHAYESKFMI